MGNEKEYALRVINSRIKYVKNYIEEQKRLAARMESEIYRKQNSNYSAGGLGVSIQYDECLSKKILKEANEKKKRALENLSGYNYILKMLMDK
jgi:hypothetical protein